ncbi:MAG: hypothetical protein RLZZ66_540 [Pseudomonadota bacterium]|jgi:hypothetical protein
MVSIPKLFLPLYIGSLKVVCLNTTLALPALCTISTNEPLLTSANNVLLMNTSGAIAAATIAEGLQI